jgi:hypothetical protein
LAEKKHRTYVVWRIDTRIRDPNSGGGWKRTRKRLNWKKRLTRKKRVRRRGKQHL